MASANGSPQRSTLDSWFFVASTTTRNGWESHAIPLPDSYRRGKAVAAGDINGDRHPDLVVTTEDGCVAWLNHPQTLAPSKRVWHLVNDSQGIKFDRLELLDLDRDGDLDILTCEERQGLGVVWYENPR